MLCKRNKHSRPPGSVQRRKKLKKQMVSRRLLLQQRLLPCGVRRMPNLSEARIMIVLCPEVWDLPVRRRHRAGKDRFNR
jgi:hypothetical protein